MEAARREGLKITADMYTYTAGATGFDACLPPWAREGGWDATFKRLEDSTLRQRIGAEMKVAGKDWENLCAAAGSPERLLLLEFKNEALQATSGQDPRRGREAARQGLDGGRHGSGSTKTGPGWASPSP